MKYATAKKILTPLQALERMRKYCAYQERSQQEARHKLLQLGQRGHELENILAQLIEENFLNEERFAIAYARGKFRMKGWGKDRIKRELKQRNISDYCINKAMKEIDAGDYKKAFAEIMKKKAATLDKGSGHSNQQKLAAYLIRKGFEPGMVWDEINKIAN